MPDSSKLYSWLLRLYPARFREEYQTPMERQFRDEYREAQGHLGRTLLWQRVLWDTMISAPAEAVRELTRDLKYSLRVYRRHPVSAVFAVVALGLAIGTSTAVFSVLNALLLRSLPFSDPAQLVELWEPPVGTMQGRAAFYDWYGRSPYLDGSMVFSSSEMNLVGQRGALRVKVAETSANFFELLGSKPALGRTFVSNEDAHGKTSVAVISHNLWQQWFGGVHDVLGMPLQLNGAVVTVIGVAPPRFDYPGNTSLWIPTAFDFQLVPKRGAFLFHTVARLKAGVSISGARSLLLADVRQAESRSKGAGEVGNRGPASLSNSRLTSLRDQLAGSVQQASWILAGLVLLVLVAACTNVAHLLLSRTIDRQQELAVRAAMGASRARLLQQLVTEAIALTAAGAALGLLVAHWAVQVAAAVAPAQLATQAYTILDFRVVGFAAALALLTGFVFGVLPAWLAGRLHPSEHVMRTRTGASGNQTKQVRAVLAALQAGLTLILLTTSVAMGRTFLQLLDTDLGLRPNNVVTLNVSLQGSRYRSGIAEWQYYSEALDRLRAVPGVAAAGAVSHLPLSTTLYMGGEFKLDSGQTVQIATNAASPGYFQAMGTKLLTGRDFEASERRHSEPAVIVNEAFANATGLGTAVLGRRLISPWSKIPYLIVGLVSTIRSGGPAHPGGPQVYWPVEEEPPPTLTFVARVSGQAEEFLSRCADAIRTVDPTVTLYDLKTLDQRLAEVLARPKFFTTATIFLATLALLLVVVGIYGAAVYSVAHRKHEMGIRMALGASHPRLRVMVVGESAFPIACGMVFGLIGAGISGTYLEHLVVNAQPIDAWTCVAGAVLLLAGGFVTAWCATTRVFAIEPADALRAE